MLEIWSHLDGSFHSSLKTGQLYHSPTGPLCHKAMDSEPSASSEEDGRLGGSWSKADSRPTQDRAWPPPPQPPLRHTWTTLPGACQRSPAAPSFSSAKGSWLKYLIVLLLSLNHCQPGSSTDWNHQMENNGEIFLVGEGQRVGKERYGGMEYGSKKDRRW